MFCCRIKSLAQKVITHNLPAWCNKYQGRNRQRASGGWKTPLGAGERFAAFGIERHYGRAAKCLPFSPSGAGACRPDNFPPRSECLSSSDSRAHNYSGVEFISGECESARWERKALLTAEWNKRKKTRTLLRAVESGREKCTHSPGVGGCLINRSGRKENAGGSAKKRASVRAKCMASLLGPAKYISRDS